jgi:MFS family permease
MLSGRVGDMYGHKKLFIIGVVLFSLASLTGGLAPSETVLILARALQGMGAAMASVYQSWPQPFLKVKREIALSVSLLQPQVQVLLLE